MVAFRLHSIALCCAAACCLCVIPACTSSPRNGTPGSAAAEVEPTGPVTGSGTGLAGLELSRLASQLTPDIHTIKPKYSGAGFNPTFPAQHAEIDGDCVVLTPGSGTGQGAAANAAYCMYPLRCYHEAENAYLFFTWAGDAPYSEHCWVGLSNWETQTWEWHNLPEFGFIEVDPATFSTADHIGVAVILVLDTAVASLKAVELACDPDGTEPFVFYCPQQDYHIYLINRQGQYVKEWDDDHYAGSSIYLTEDLEVIKAVNSGTNPIQATGAGGVIERWDFDGNVLWSVDLGSMGYSPHHDIEPMPNGNFLVIAWESVTRAEAIEEGRNPAAVGTQGFYVDSIIEVEPVEPEGGVIVWEWHLLDHLVQEYDETKNNFGVVLDNPGLLNFNFNDSTTADLTHANAVDYNADLDQIALSLHSTNEIYIIDHSTTTAEAAGHTGGTYGRGGDFLYRWGNPQMWGNGTGEDQLLYGQHDIEWIPEGYPGEGNLLLFNNGSFWGENRYSRVLEIIPPLNENGSYDMTEGTYGPETWHWMYAYDPPGEMFSMAVSSSQRLPDGNTLICVGMSGWFLEVDPEGNVVWQFHNYKPQASMASVFRADTYYLFNPWLNLTEIE